MVRTFIVGSLAASVASAASLALAQSPTEFESGHTALQVFDADGAAAMPLWVKIWLGILLATFASGLVFVWKHPIARWAVGGLIASFILPSMISGMLGLPFLSGTIAIGHIVFWTPALVLLLKRRSFLSSDYGSAFRAWSGLLTAVILFSFVFDVPYAISYIMHVAG